MTDPADTSPTLDDSAVGYWPAQSAWDKEQADTPLYSADGTLSLAEIAILSVIAAAVLVICIWVARVVWPILAVLWGAP